MAEQQQDTCYYYLDREIDGKAVVRLVTTDEIIARSDDVEGLSRCVRAANMVDA